MDLHQKETPTYSHRAFRGATLCHCSSRRTDVPVPHDPSPRFPLRLAGRRYQVSQYNQAPASGTPIRRAHSRIAAGLLSHETADGARTGRNVPTHRPAPTRHRAVPATNPAIGEFSKVMTSLKNPNLQSAELTVSSAPFTVQARVDVTPAGLLSIAVLVCGILFSTAAIVSAAKRPHRRALSW